MHLVKGGNLNIMYKKHCMICITHSTPMIEEMLNLTNVSLNQL